MPVVEDLRKPSQGAHRAAWSSVAHRVQGLRPRLGGNQARSRCEQITSPRSCARPPRLLLVLCAGADGKGPRPATGHPDSRSVIAQREVFGFSAQDIQATLIKAWRMPALAGGADERGRAPRIPAHALSRWRLLTRARHSTKGLERPALPDDFEAIAALCPMGREPLLRRLGLAPRRPRHTSSSPDLHDLTATGMIPPPRTENRFHERFHGPHPRRHRDRRGVRGSHLQRPRAARAQRREGMGHTLEQRHDGCRSSLKYAAVFAVRTHPGQR